MATPRLVYPTCTRSIMGYPHELTSDHTPFGPRRIKPRHAAAVRFEGAGYGLFKAVTLVCFWP
jgi:hypothetical protein